MRLRRPTTDRVGYGHRRLHILSQRVVWAIDAERVCWLGCQERLTARRKKPRRRASIRHRDAGTVVDRAGQSWAMDCTSDALADAASTAC